MLNISLETLIAVAPQLGQEQETREPIREAQDWQFASRIQREASVGLPLRPERTPFFCVAPLDILVEHGSNGSPRFQLAELNGTGIGGLTNMCEPAVEATWWSMAEIPGRLPQTEEGAPPLVVVASSGREDPSNPRVNKLYYEKILYADALRHGFETLRGEKTDILGIEQVGQEFHWRPRRPTVLLGHFRELAEAMTCDADGRLWLGSAQVSATINDRFCLNLYNRFHQQIDLNNWFTANRCFVAGGDKGTAYDLSNRFMAGQPDKEFPHINKMIHFALAHSREELIGTVLDWVRSGRRTVIKPQATGLGHGIEFFLEADESESEIIDRIDHSLEFVAKNYDFQGGGLPYTVCEFLDTARVMDPSHELYDHKYELRIVVYRDGEWLRPFPSIAKVSPERYLPGVVERSMLINNVTASASETKKPGRDYILPLSNHETLKSLGIDEPTLVELCRYCTSYVRSIIEGLTAEQAEQNIHAKVHAA